MNFIKKSWMKVNHVKSLTIECKLFYDRLTPCKDWKSKGEKWNSKSWSMPGSLIEFYFYGKIDLNRGTTSLDFLKIQNDNYSRSILSTNYKWA